MGKLRQIGRKVGRAFKKVGKRLKRALGKLARGFGKLGPLGSIALSFILPGMGGWISGLAKGNSFLQPIAQGLVNASKFVKNGIGTAFNRVTDAVEYGMNRVGSMFGGAGTGGSRFRDFVSDVTNGFIKPSDIEADTFTTELVDVTDAKAGDVIGETTVVGKRTKTDYGDFKVFDSDKPSVFEKGDYDSFRDRITSSREYDVYKKIAPVQVYGTSLIQDDADQKAAEEFAQSQTALYFADEAQKNLLRQQDGNLQYINFLSPEPTTEELYNAANSYSVAFTA